MILILSYLMIGTGGFLLGFGVAVYCITAQTHWIILSPEEQEVIDSFADFEGIT